MNKVLIHRRVIKFLDNLEENRRVRILEVLKSLRNFPLIRADIKKIGSKTYRLRIGNIRIIFDFDKCENAVFVKRVDYRGRAYKK
ncbi:MAG: type II toxin-antitoxin system RelE/ParE family toxin [Archaeoglobales archaeon]|nr:MAG: type II toxin-antitoxin system RelE/ParE family toxin [Archaeoglobales archaeon]